MAIGQLQLPSAQAITPNVDWSSLSNLGKVYQAAQADQVKKQTLAQLGQGGKVDGAAITQAGLQLGDMSLTSLGTQLQNTEYSHSRDEKNDTRQAARDSISDQHWAASFGLQKEAAARAGEDKFSVQKRENPDGTTSFFKYNSRTGDLSPIGPEQAVAAGNPFSAGGKFNGDQGKAAGFTDRMLGAEAVLSGVGPVPGEQGPVSPGVQEQGKSWLQRDLNQAPFGVSNFAISADQQKFNQSKSDFINAQLRRESGAAIGKDEYVNADKQYFPQPGDGSEVIRQKAANRRSAIEAMGREGGGSYKPKLNYGTDGTLVPYEQTPAPVQAPAPVAQSAAPAPPQRGQLVQGYRFKGGDPADQNNWAKAQ